MKIKKETIIRTTLTGIALLNSILTMANKNPLPFSEDDMYLFLSTLATAGTTVWAWWKNNSFTQSAMIADVTLSDLRDDNLDGFIGEAELGVDNND